MLRSAASLGWTFAVETSLQDGIDVNAQDDEGMTALHHAAAHGARACVLLLVQSGRCDFLLQDTRGRYASDLSQLWAKDFALARLLRKKQRHQADAQGVQAWKPLASP